MNLKGISEGPNVISNYSANRPCNTGKDSEMKREFGTERERDS